MTREQEIIWLAGLLEGEGTFFLEDDAHPNHRKTIRVKLEMCDKDVVMHAAKIFPSSVTPYNCVKIGAKRQTSYTARWAAARGEQVMRAVLPYMGERRAAKIRECLSTPNLSHHPRERKVTS